MAAWDGPGPWPGSGRRRAPNLKSQLRDLPPVQLQALRSVQLHLGAGSDIRLSLEALAKELNASGFVLGVVGNLSQAAFQCPGQAEPTILEGDLEIITLQGTVSPEGVHLHLSFSDGSCQVWGGHLEPGTLVQKGADLLVGLLEEDQGTVARPTGSNPRQLARANPTGARPGLQQVAPENATMGTRRPPVDPANAVPRVEIALLAGCPYCARALRMLRTLGIAYRVVPPSGGGSLPQVSIDGVAIGGYDALAERHGRGELEALRQG